MAFVHSAIALGNIDKAGRRGSRYRREDNNREHPWHEWGRHPHGHGRERPRLRPRRSRPGPAGTTIRKAVPGPTHVRRRGDDAIYSYDYSDGRRDTVIDGGSGTDLAIIIRSSITAARTFTLADPGATQVFHGTSVVGIEQVQLSSGSGNDNLTGGALDDVLSGGAGNDEIRAQLDQTVRTTSCSTAARASIISTILGWPPPPR